MQCTQCGSPRTTHVSPDKQRWYCTECKHTWAIKLENKEGTLSFDGVPAVKNLMLVLDKAGLDPVTKLTFATQLTATLYDQWFEGFKGGLLADFVHKKDIANDGENSARTTGNEGEHSGGNQAPGSFTDQDGITRSQAGNASGGARRVRERIAGVEVIRPSNITLKEEHIEKIAQMVSQDSFFTIKDIETDGVSLKVQYYLH